MQDLVVLDVVQEGRRHDIGVAGHVHRRATDPDQRRVELGDEGRNGRLAAVELVPQHAPAAPPGDHQVGEGRRHREREPAAGGDLERVGGEVAEIDQQEEAEDQRCGRAPQPQRPGSDQAGQHGVDRHGAGDRDAVGGGEVARGAEAEHQQQHARHQEPVDARDVDLADRGGARCGVTGIRGR